MPVSSSLFQQTKNVENNLGKIVFSNSNFVNKTSFLPSNGFPFILNLKASNNRVEQRYEATTAERWLKLHPELIQRTRNVTFACNLFAELSKGIEDPSKCILIIVNIMKKQLLTSLLFAFFFVPQKINQSNVFQQNKFKKT